MSTLATPHSTLQTPFFPAMVGSGAAMTQLRERMERVATTSETVLIQGENGTGKELVARVLHETGNRNHAPWVTLNCPALSSQLMESELFGHRKGAFTGADYDRVGRFEMANGGTLLLDEISEIDTHLQSKLLRVIQERTFERVGSCDQIAVDVRIIATTNRDLSAEIAAGRFREDLFHRLAVLPITVPPLRHRKEDITELVTYFATKTAARLNCEPLRFSNTAIDVLTNYSWPGNVRQLENVMTRLAIFADGDTVDPEDVRSWLFECSGMSSQSPFQPIESKTSVNRLVSARFSPGHGIVRWQEAPPELSPHTSCNEAVLPFVGMTLDEMEEQLIRLTLERFNGHRAKTAAALGIGLRTLTTKIKGLGARGEGREESIQHYSSPLTPHPSPLTPRLS